MAKQEKIREGLDSLFYEMGLGDNIDHETFSTKILSYLHSQGVVIKVDGESFASICGYCEYLNSCKEEHSECDKFKLEAGYVAVEPLIKGKEVK